MKFYHALKKARIAKKMTLRESAKEVGISHASLFQIEKGEQETTKETLEKLVRLYNIDPLWFYWTFKIIPASIQTGLIDRKELFEEVFKACWIK